MKEIAFDLETTGLDPFKDRIIAIGMVSNDENVVIIGDIEETDPEGIDRQKQLCRYVLQELDRIVQYHSTPI